MHLSGLPIVPAALLAALLVLVGGCEGCEKADPPRTGAAGQHELEHQQGAAKSDGSIIGTLPEGLEEQTLELDMRLIMLAGQVDYMNRYVATVAVTAYFSGGEKKGCSGVAAGPRIVMTAGHCVCRPQESPSSNDGTKLITAMACAENAIVSAEIYRPTEEAPERAPSTGYSYKGKINPHPDLRVSLDKDEVVTSSKADLAIILLNRPLEKEIQPFPFANTEVQAGELITVAGYGYDELLDVHGSSRRFSKNKVIKLPAPDNTIMLLQRPEGHIYRQDSGGPCLREAGSRIELVGISSRNLSAGETCISINNYKGWLLGEIQRAAKGN
jgi:hypothetical protein